MTDTKPAPVLEAKDIVAGYGEVDILHGVSITVHAGEMVAIIGPNGAGKSTLLRTIFGLLAARRGQINLMGQDITNCAPDELVLRGLTVRASVEAWLQRPPLPQDSLPAARHGDALPCGE
ncbi:MAG: ATP-binding cassette domain-containing protein [Chloroflexi bacterium]|nr:ATP-binding cassette domain-containing protein [Chloroflexota bacterium]